jgi:hypothetical protein
VLPRVYLLLGQRFTLDSYVFNNVTYDRVQDLRPARRSSACSRASSTCSSCSATTEPATTSSPSSTSTTTRASSTRCASSPTRTRTDFWDATFYNGWLAAIRSLNDGTEFEARPEAMRTAAWADKTLNTQTASWAELRHDTLLYVKQSYSGGEGCEYPDAYVEPLPAFYARLAHLGQLGGEMAEQLGADGFPVDRASTFFANLRDQRRHPGDHRPQGARGRGADPGRVRVPARHHRRGAGRLRRLAVRRLVRQAVLRRGQDRRVQADDRRRAHRPHRRPGNEKGWVLHAATGRPMLLVFTMESCSGVKSYIGPVSSYHSVLTEDYDRQTDSAWATMFDGGATPARPQWTESFVR